MEVEVEAVLSVKAKARDMDNSLLPKAWHLLMRILMLMLMLTRLIVGETRVIPGKIK